jgi:thiol-disulfide isomerase/thioredoxin
VTAATTALGVGLLVNLALTFALIRRVRRHGEQLAQRPVSRWPMVGLPAGGKMPELAVRTVSGQTRSLRDLTGARSIVAFLATGCQACRTQLPELTGYARRTPGGAAQVLAVVCGDENAAVDLVHELDGAASVVLEPLDGPLQAAFSVSRYPVFYLLDDNGRVVAAGPRLRQLASAQPA